MMRYMSIDAIERDPAWMKGDYTAEPEAGLRTAIDLTLVMGSAPLQMQKLFPTRAAAEHRIDTAIPAAMARTDANDTIYQFDASRTYDPSSRLSTITAPVLWINSADDFINPPELGIAQAMVGRMPHARFILIPISDATRGHGTHTQAAVWKDDLAAFMRETER